MAYIKKIKLANGTVLDIKAMAIEGVTATAAELNYCDGVTSAIQTQLDGKQASNLVTAISSSSDNDHYPSAKCVYDAIGAAIGTAIAGGY